MTDMLYPAIEPLESGQLPVGGGNRIYWEISGRDKGPAALYLHGGPGSSLGSGRYRRLFDPGRYRIVGLDQRGCGRSWPLAIDALDRLADNNTDALIADIETLRQHLGIATWVVTGVSWGVTLALAYAEAHPERVTRMVLGAITTTSRDEVDWITGAIGRIFPEAFERFAEDSLRRNGERIVEAYARRLAGDDLADQTAATRAWNDWESTHVSLDPNWSPIATRFEERQGRAFATLVTHYWAHDGLLRNGREILAATDRLAGIPAVLIHGRRDIGSPALTAYRLHRQWPGSLLIMLSEEGHGGPAMAAAMRAALDET